jgi:hypothetical protein
MGIDTRYWGPSGWDLFHRIAFHSKHPKNVLRNMAEVLPCKFCRNSTRQYVKELPYNSKNPAKWLYDIHNKVNDKLRTQCAKDPKVVNPGEDPSFEEIEQRYKDKNLDEKIGNEFLQSIAVNYTPTPKRTEIQKRFLKDLAEAYPLFKTFYDEHPPDFSNYPEWMHKFTNVSIEEVKKNVSKCKTGRTCRKSKGGRRRFRYTQRK